MGTSSSLTGILLAALIGGWCVGAGAAARQPVMQKPAAEPPAASPAAGPDPAVNVPPAPSDADIALACASVRLMLEEYTKEEDQARQGELLARADKRIRDVVSDPSVGALEPWRLAGIIASRRKDAQLAAFAFEAIQRLKPGFASDPALLKIMAALDAMGVRPCVNMIRRDREIVQNTISQALKCEVDAAFHLGVKYWSSEWGVLENRTLAMYWFSRAAQAGHVNAMYNLGLGYANGKGVPSDKNKAIEWWTKASQLGHVRAKNELDQEYELRRSHDREHISVEEYGRGALNDERDAVAWYEKMADAGDTLAMVNLGWMLYSGVGAPPDDGKSVEWKIKAADAGNPYAIAQVAFSYRGGGSSGGIRRNGFPIDKCQSFAWYTRLAESSSNWAAIAMYTLGTMYVKGECVSEDEAKAVEWFTKAARAGNPSAQDALRERGLAW